MSNGINIRLAYNFGYHHSDSPFIRALRRLEFGIDFGVRMPTGGSISEEASAEYVTTGNGGIQYSHWNGTIKGDYSYNTGADVNLSLLYPVNDNLSIGIMAGAGIIRGKDEISERWDYNKELYPEESDYMLSRDEKYTDLSIPVALRGKYRFRQISIAKKFYPFAQLDLGASIAPNQSEEATAFYWSPAVGVALDVAGGRHSIELGVGYVPQNVRKCDYERVDISSTNPLGRYRETYGTQTIGSLRISLGYTF